MLKSKQRTLPHVLISTLSNLSTCGDGFLYFKGLFFKTYMHVHALRPCIQTVQCKQLMQTFSRLLKTVLNKL